MKICVLVFWVGKFVVGSSCCITFDNSQLSRISHNYYTSYQQTSRLRESLSSISAIWWYLDVFDDSLIRKLFNNKQKCSDYPGHASVENKQRNPLDGQLSIYCSSGDLNQLIPSTGQDDQRITCILTSLISRMQSSVGLKSNCGSS